MNNKVWLNHLSNEVMRGARNNNLCSYVIALEGWRRGLELTFYSKLVKKDTLHAPGLLFSLSDGKELHMFYKSRGYNVKNEAFTIGGNKFKAKIALDKAGVPVPKGKLFSGDTQDSEVIKYAKEIGYPVVLKPSNAAQGKGVIANIENEEFLKESLNYVRKQLGYSEIILEEHVFGDEYRVYVMHDDVIAVLNRDPANVVGDGKRTIKELINKKNKDRKKNPRLYSCLIKVDYEIENILKDKGLSLETIPEKNEKIYLRSKSNITSGGDSIDVTDEFPDEIKKVAVDALKAIPNFPNGGVDIMVDPNKSTLDSAKVIELTPVPQIGSLVFPMSGKARDIPSAIIDEYFPETRELSNNNPNIYFYLPDILRPLVNKTASEVKVIPCPTNIELQKKVIVTGSFGQNKTLRAVRKLALENNLHGYVQKIKTNQVEIGIAGTNDDISTFISLLKKISPIDDLLDKEWNAPIKVGFEIKKSILDKEVVANNKQTHRKKGVFVRLFNKLS